MSETFSLSLDGDDAGPVSADTDRDQLRRMLEVCGEFWIVSRSGDESFFVQFAPESSGGSGHFEHWRAGNCLFTEIWEFERAFQQLLLFMADSENYAPGRA